ncbi:protein nutcracker isoform X1 [Anastrepha obliqua]|uniref:protein nutcracker isoform X1 n=2 Tax=Anastrepha obliqua TaxID=95512 RepID=UPI002409C02F|nr:protein nutcracker isoform X1 [Anastrepha obliqua]
MRNDSTDMEKNDTEDSFELMLESLNEISQLLDKKPLSQAHLLYLAVHVIALHTGFIPENLFMNNLKSLFPVDSWSTFHKKNVKICCCQQPTYKYDSPHETYFTENFITSVKLDQDDMSNLKTVLSAIVTGDFMLITLTPHPSTQLLGRSSCLSIGRYVISHSENRHSIEKCYQKLDQLRLQLRNEVLMPMRNSQLTLIDAFPQPSFLGIPRELRFRIYKYLLPVERVKLGQVNKSISEEIFIFTSTIISKLS